MTDPDPNQTPAPTPGQPQPAEIERTLTEPVPVTPLAVAATAPAAPLAPPVSPPPPPVAPAGVPYEPSPVPTARVVSAQDQRKRGFVDAILVVVAVLAIGGIGFAAGRMTAPASSFVRTTAAFPNGVFPNGNNGNGNNGNGNNGNGNNGNGNGNNGNGNNGNGNGNGGQGGLGGGFGARGFGAGLAVQGQVTEVTTDHLTLKLASGQTVQIPLDASTQYHQQTGASSSDVKSGSQVLVQLGQRTGSASNGSGGRTLPAASSVTIVGQ